MSNFNLLWEREYEVSLDFINKIQNYFGIKFPINYIDIIRAYDAYGLEVLGKGNKTYEPMIEFNNGRFEIVSFFQFREYEAENDPENTEIVESHKEDSEYLPNPEKMIVFAATAGKHFYLFDYRENENEPAIVFWDTDESMDDAYNLSKEEFERIYGMSVEEGKNRGFYKIADSFDEFMEKIVPFED